MENVQLHYQYRDAHGSKRCAYVIFANPDNLKPEEIELRLERALWEGEFFVADQIRIPEVFLYLDGTLDDELDHCFHHFDSVDLTSETPTDKYNRSIRQFIREVEDQSQRGWQLFDPIHRLRNLEPNRSNA